MLMLHRPVLPGQRAQTIQVLHMARAFAACGVEVTVLANRHDASSTIEAALDALGLTPCPQLRIRMAPSRQRGIAGAWFRLQIRRWSRGAPGVIYARDLRRLVEASGVWGTRHRVVLEVHGRTSGDVGAPSEALETERAALRLAHAVVANCEGTAREWQETHARILPGPVVVEHNGTAVGRRRDAVPDDGVVRGVGSLRSFKGWHTLVEAALQPGVGPVEIVGGRAAELGQAETPGVSVCEAIPFPQVPDLLARSSALVLPLANNRFGRVLTSPLKLFDYLATAVPLVLPQLPSVTAALAAAGAESTGVVRYRPDDPSALAEAILRARALPPRAPVVRTWQARAEALLPVVFPVRSSG